MSDRPRWLVHALGLCLLGAGCLPAPACAAERITWLMPEFVLANPLTPGQARRGMAEPMAEHLMRHWPEATHEVLMANAKRSWRMIEAGEQACHLVSLRTPEREQVAYFANTHLVPPVQLIARRELVAQLPRNAGGDVDLDRLLSERRLRGALIEGRSYGNKLDAQLARRPPQAIDLYVPSDFGGRLLQMVAMGRADYSIDYDFTLQLQREELPALKELVSLPIQGSSEPMLSGVACPRNEWGRRIIARVEKIFGSAAGVNALRRNFDHWTTPEARAVYGVRINNFYNELLLPRK
nr:TIGR02285 family protein [uncultured Roseateles sp.]